MSNKLRLYVWLLSMASLCVVAGRAQAPVGSLTGTVHDPSGLVMPGVSVTVTNKDNGQTRALTTSSDGSFTAASLAPGNYAIQAKAEGFRELDVTATVQVGQTVSVDLVMQIGSADTTVNVAEEVAPINYDSQAIGGVIAQKQIESLPLNGREFLQLAMLEPGVSVSANNVGQYNKQFDVSILGSSSANNSVRITVDGATVQDAITGGTQQNFSQEVVQEFQLSSTNYDLSTGIGAGGAINVVTRSGGNDFHGSLFFFYRDHNMSAFPTLGHDPGEPSSPYFARKQYGYWLGGPIKKDKLFFFSALEHIDQTALISAFPSDPLLQGFGANNPSPYHANELTERFDWRINDKNTAFLRYSHDGNNSFAPPGLGDLPSDWNNNTNWADSGVFSVITVVTPNIANEFRYSYTYWSNSNLPPSYSECPAPCSGWLYKNAVGTVVPYCQPGQTCTPYEDGPMVTILGVNNFAMGQSANAPQTRLVRRHIFADNVSWQKGTHAIKFGGYWEYQKGTGTYAYADPAAMELYSPEDVAEYNQIISAEGYGKYQIGVPSAFNTVADLLKLPVKEFTIGVGDPVGYEPPAFQAGNANHDNMFHLYAEDTWKFRKNLTINYGLAWSFESNALNYDLPKPAYLDPVMGDVPYEHNSPHNFSPMLGFAWTVGKDNKTVIRGGSAIYYDTWNIYNRLIERVILGPVGTGRVPLSDSSFFSKVCAFAGCAALPPALQPTSLSSHPIPFSGGALDQDLNLFIEQANAVLAAAGPPNNNSLAIQNVDLFKTGFGLIPSNFRLPYSEHASIGMQRQLRTDLVLTADFVFRQYMHQLISGADLNDFNSATGPVIPACTGSQALLLPGQKGYTECSSGPIEAFISGARASYKGLLMKLSKTFSHRTAGTLSYAYADQIGYNGLVNNDNWFASVGPQAGHQTLSGSLVANLPWGIVVSGITSFQSPQPFEPYLQGIDLSGSGIFRTANESPLTGSPLPGAQYNSFGVTESKADLIRLVNQFNANYYGKTDAFGTPIGCPSPTNPGQVVPCTVPANFQMPRSFNSQDVRVSKVFQYKERWTMTVNAECFNVFNIANLTDYNWALNAPGFGQATLRTANTFGTGGPRAFQFSARLRF